MASWWNSTSANTITRGLSSITGQLSTNLKDILTEASEETFDPTAELTRAQEQIGDLEFRKQALTEECASLKKQCDELIMQKQAAEIKSDMLLAESRRSLDEKDNELKRLRETSSSASWNNTDLNNTWTDILEDDQPEISEYLKYQKVIRDLKDENTHLRDEMVTLRKSIKSQQSSEQKQHQRDEEYEEQIRQLQTRLGQHQADELRRTLEVQKEVDDVDKDLLLQQLEQANQKLSLSNERNQQLEMELEQVQQKNAVLLSEERQRCDALVADNEDIQRRLEEQRAQIEQCLTQLRTKEEQIVELSEKDDLRDVQLEKNETSLLLQIQQLKEELAAKDREGDEDRGKEFHLREILEGQIIELNEDLQSMESEKNDLHQQVTQLKDQIRQFENTSLSPGSPAVPVSSSPDTRTRSPSPSTFEHVLELEAQILRNEEQMRELNSVYDRFITLLPIELSSTDEHQQSSLSHRFVHLFEQWSTYVDTLSITQQELDSLKQLLIEKQEDLEKLQFDLDLTTTKLIEEQQAAKEQSSRIEDNVDDEEEIEHILEVHRHAQRAPSRQSLISSTPGEKQQLIAQNELLSTLLAEKDRELIGLQQAEKTREDLLKNLETLRNQMRQIELEQEFKQVELNDIRNVLDEKIRENSSLKKEKMSFIEKLADLERDRQEQQSMIQVQPKQAIQEEEEKPTTVAESTENKTFDQEQFDKLRADYDQLVEFSKKQHDESLSYYNEYARILALHNELNSKQSQLQVDYDSLQSLIQQKNEAYLQCQNELNNYQNLFYHEKKKAEEVDLLRSTLIERENKLQQYLANERDFLVKQAELERELKVLEQKNFDYQGEESLQLELERTRDERDLVVVEKKQMENEIEATRQKSSQWEERERKLTSEIDRLRKHLLQMEESYTTDLLAAEDREKTLRNQIAQFEDSHQAQNELIQQLNTSGEQSKQTLVTELAALKHEFGKLDVTNKNLNQQLQYQMKCSQNLQNVLEQFKREREQHLNEHLRQYQDALRDQTALVNRLTSENNEIRQRLTEYNEAMAAAHRLNDQLDKNQLLIETLRNELHERDKQIQQYQFNLRDLQSTSGSRVEKHLVKNILLSYFHTPVDKRQEVVPLLGALVGFTQEEYRKAIDANSTGNSPKAASGWLSGWLGGNASASGLNAANRTRTQSETPAYDPNKSFTELLIQYVDQQSTTNAQLHTAKFNTDEYLQRYDQNSLGGSGHLSRKASVSASSNPFINSTFSSLNKPSSTVVVPTGPYLPEGSVLPPPPPPLPAAPLPATTAESASSSTILKDLLKT